MVSTHSRLKAAGILACCLFMHKQVSTHSRLKAAGVVARIFGGFAAVSTHSRLKAAGLHIASNATFYRGFNTQPPKGGWGSVEVFGYRTSQVSTHSRLKAAGSGSGANAVIRQVSTHSRLKAAGRHNGYDRPADVCFNTQPPKGGWILDVLTFPVLGVSTHSRLKAAGF